MDIHQQHQCTRFSLAAANYDQQARVQRAVADRLMQGLSFLGNASRVLDIGCGTGHLTRRLAEAWPRAYVLGIDHAPGMIQEALRLNRHADRPRFEVADALCYRPAEPFDLIASSSTLHWMQPLDFTMKILAGFLIAGGSFAFALMIEGTLRELHAARDAVAPDRPPHRRMPSESNVRCALEGAKLRVFASEIEERRIHAPTACELIHGLRRIGVTGGPLSRGQRPLTRAQVDAFFERYDSLYRDPCGVYASFRVGYFWGARDV